MEHLASHPLRKDDGPRSQTRPFYGIRRILVCLDRSPFSEACLRYATLLSKVFGSAITLLHLMQSGQETAAMRSASTLDWEFARREATSYLERVQQEVAGATGQHVDTRLEQGYPAERIAAMARELHADLTIIGSHGERGWTSWNLGSTTQQVVAVARGSVMIARASLPLPSTVALKRLLVPLDGSLRTECVLPMVIQLAKAHQAEVLLIHVVPEPVPSELIHAGEDMELARELASRVERRAKDYLERIRERLAHEIPSVHTRVCRHIDKRQFLLELARNDGSDLVVLSAHGATCNPAQPFGSVAEHLLAHSPVPLLVFQDLREHETNHDPEKRAPALRASYPPEEA